MKKPILTILLCCMMIGLTGCGKTNTNSMTIDGITMKIKEKSLTTKGLTLIIKDKTNQKYTFGESFYLEKKNNDGWEKVKEIHSDYEFNDIGYSADSDQGLELEQNWDDMYGSLEKGSYRLVKTTSKESDKPITDKNTKYISVNFEIASTNSDYQKYDDYEKISSLSSDKASTEVLVKFAGTLYGKSYALIDYAGGSEPIGIIDKLIDQEYVPKLDGETNTKEILNAQVFSKTDHTIVLQYNNEYVLFEKITE